MTITALAIALLLLAFAAWTVVALNRLAHLRNQVCTACADVDAQSIRLHDLATPLASGPGSRIASSSSVPEYSSEDGGGER
ncbi:MAG: hypothetical protein ACREO7_09315 [Pseudoxanthomonas sp.]